MSNLTWGRIVQKSTQVGALGCSVQKFGGGCSVQISHIINTATQVLPTYQYRCPTKLILLPAAHLPILTLNASYKIIVATQALPTYKFLLLATWGVTNHSNTEMKYRIKNVK